MNITQQIKEIKQEFRFFMNGVTATSMRDKGVNYKVNWGISMLDLKEMAKRYAKNKDLSLGLWHENARECKILATLLMTDNELIFDDAKAIIEEIETQEMAELWAINVFSKVEFAEELAFYAIEKDNVFAIICAYSILARLFMNGINVENEHKELFLCLSNKHLKTGSSSLQQVVSRCLLRYQEMDIQ